MYRVAKKPTRGSKRRFCIGVLGRSTIEIFSSKVIAPTLFAEGMVLGEALNVLRVLTSTLIG